MSDGQSRSYPIDESNPEEKVDERMWVNGVPVNPDGTIDIEYISGSTGGDGDSYWVEDADGNLTPEADQPVSVERERITDTSNITVNVPSDFSTVSAALSDAALQQVPSGTQVVINIETGHDLTEQVELVDGDWSHVRIQSEDATVGVDPNASLGGPAAFVIERSNGPQFDFVLDCTEHGSGFDGVRIYEGWGHFQQGTGVINADASNLHTEGAFVVCRACDFTGAGAKGIEADKGSIISASSTDVSGSNFGVASFEGSQVSFRDGVANNCTDRGLTANREGYICAHDAEAENAGFINVLASDISVVDIRNGSVQNANDFAVFARRGGRVLADRARIDTSGNYTLYVEKGGIIHAWGPEGTSNGSWGAAYPNAREDANDIIQIQEGKWSKAGLIVSNGVSDGRYSWTDFAFGASATSGAQPLTAGEDTLVQFSNAHTDPHGNWDSSVYEYEVPESGIWDVSAQTWFRNSSAGDQLWFSAGVGDPFSIGTDGHATGTQTADAGDNTLSVSRKLKLNAGAQFIVAAKNADGDDELGKYEGMTFVNLSFVRPFHPGES